VTRLIRNKPGTGSTRLAGKIDVMAKRAHEHGVSTDPSELRAKGRRVTRQRRLIWDTFSADPERHLSADDVVTAVQAELPTVNPSTVYRTLDLLVVEGLLRRTDLGSGRAFYEVAHEHPHHHVVCESCGAVAHFHEEALGDSPNRITAATGYTLGEGEVTLYGLCPRCRAAR
jgi:Fur family ferric uptake transcriptional regulator